MIPAKLLAQFGLPDSLFAGTSLALQRGCLLCWLDMSVMKESTSPQEELTPITVIASDRVLQFPNLIAALSQAVNITVIERSLESVDLLLDEQTGVLLLQEGSAEQLPGQLHQLAQDNYSRLTKCWLIVSGSPTSGKSIELVANLQQRIVEFLAEIPPIEFFVRVAFTDDEAAQFIRQAAQSLVCKLPEASVSHPCRRMQTVVLGCR